MKHLKKLNAKGFAHWVVPAVAIIVIGGIGTYLLTRSHADTLTAQAACGSGFKYAEGYHLTGNITTNPYGGQGYGDWGPAYVNLYINTATKKACAVTMSTGTAYGVAKPMTTSVKLTCYENGKDVTKNSAADSGTYKYYAGPARISYLGYGTNTHCGFLVYGKMTYKSIVYSLGPREFGSVPSVVSGL